MRVRALTPTGDMSFGQSASNFLVDVPLAVAQCIQTTLKLWQGEWFLDQTAGVPWAQNVLGRNTAGYYDLVLQQAILSVPGVVNLVSYSSNLNRDTRALTVQVTVNTQYSQNQVVVATAGFPRGSQ